MNNKEAIELLDKYLAGKCSPEEKILVEHTYNLFEDPVQQTMSESQLIKMKTDMWRSVEQRTMPTGTVLPVWRNIAAAAAVVLVALSAGLYFYSDHKGSRSVDSVTLMNDIQPGGNKATLTLSNGKRISLNDVTNGKIAEEAGIKIEKTADGQLIYTIADAKASRPGEFNTIETPKGGQYQLTLPDGTKVWLNAASSLKYPLDFKTKTHRKIKLIGEAYFEVAKDKQRPFIVETTMQTVEVLGTHFNINSYSDEPSSKTTLIEGSVKVSNKSGFKILQPGQQSSLTETKIELSEIDIEDAKAWKNGLFVFSDEPLESIMRKVSRWYDVDIVYKGVDVNELYWGSISRYDNISKVLKKLSVTGGITFKIEGRRIIASK